MIKFFKSLFIKTVVSMQCESQPYNLGKSWRSTVVFDDFGAPYAKAHDGKLTRLYEGGNTGDSTIYGTRWKLYKGPPIHEKIK